MDSSLKKQWISLQNEFNALDGEQGIPLVVAVSKRQSIEKISELYSFGQRNFGENYLQEAEKKISSLANLDICWHFIGSIQTKKITKIVRLFQWIQSVDSFRCAKKISECAVQSSRKLNILLQVNIADEATKGGLLPEELDEVIPMVLGLKGVVLRGLMIFPPLYAEGVSPWLKKGEELYRMHCEKWGGNFDTLSMGTSEDYSDAILAGANMVRLGQILFGERLN